MGRGCHFAHFYLFIPAAISIGNCFDIRQKQYFVGQSITQTLHDEIANELEAKQQELNDRLKSLTSDNKSFALTSSCLLDLAQRAEELFLASDERLRQKLLEYVLSNIELNDKKLSILGIPYLEYLNSS